MNSGPQLQLASTLDANQLTASLQASLSNVHVEDPVSFFQFTQLNEYILAAAPKAGDILGNVVLLRLEDWLREQLISTAYESSREVWARQELRPRLDEFVNQIALLAALGKPVWLAIVPSNGWIAAQHKLEGIFRTYSNLVSARVGQVHGVSTLQWPAAMSAEGVLDRERDLQQQIPFSDEGFKRLGEWLSARIAPQLAGGQRSGATSSAGSSELAAYLAGLNVRIELVPADNTLRDHVERLARTAASFSLTGERPNISADEVDELLQSGTCLLVKVSDRFSDYGFAGVIVFRVEGDALVVTSMALSCTVLGKQVEYAVLSVVRQIASDRGLHTIMLKYVSAARNQPIVTFLRSIGEDESGTYVLPLESAESRIQKACASPGAWNTTYEGSAHELSRVAEDAE